MLMIWEAFKVFLGVVIVVAFVFIFMWIGILFVPLGQ